MEEGSECATAVFPEMTKAEGETAGLRVGTGELLGDRTCDRGHDSSSSDTVGLGLRSNAED